MILLARLSNLRQTYIYINLILRHSSPHWEIVTGVFGLLFGPVGMFSIFRTTKSPSSTRPETFYIVAKQPHMYMHNTIQKAQLMPQARQVSYKQYNLGDRGSWTAKEHVIRPKNRDFEGNYKYI